jgi:hypothetical protein
LKLHRCPRQGHRLQKVHGLREKYKQHGSPFNTRTSAVTGFRSTEGEPLTLIESMEENLLPGSSKNKRNFEDGFVFWILIKLHGFEKII